MRSIFQIDITVLLHYIIRHAVQMKIKELAYHEYSFTTLLQSDIGG